MRTHELARYLEHLARILREGPDVKFDPESPAGVQTLLPGMQFGGKAAPRPSKPLPAGEAEKLSLMAPGEVENYLLSDANGFTAENLAQLAHTYGLKFSKRQSRNAMANLIMRHFEAANMHKIMRGGAVRDHAESAEGDEPTSR